MDAVAAAPPPGLMHKGSMRGIHQPDDAVVHAHRHVGGQIGKLVFVAKLLHLRGWVGSVGRLRDTCTRGRRVRHVDPDEAVLFVARIAPGVNAVHTQFLIRGE